MILGDWGCIFLLEYLQVRKLLAKRGRGDGVSGSPQKKHSIGEAPLVSMDVCHICLNASSYVREFKKITTVTATVTSLKKRLNVRYNLWYISLPSSAKQQREITKFYVLQGTWCTTTDFYFKCFALPRFNFVIALTLRNKRKWLKGILRFVG